MSMTDPLADMLTRIRNGQKARLVSIKCSYSKVKHAVLNVLKEEGYISDFAVEDSGSFKELEITPKFSRLGKGAINEIARVSKPGKRYTTSIKDLPSHYNGLGIFVLSTSKGVVSDREARRLGVGGEVICKVF
ncbi:MAG: 30S ribosomal protein S8 [Rickettsiaceae bacterium]|nr:30S ribosomal protein S8 [Rickettsiaceae bacterium]